MRYRLVSHLYRCNTDLPEGVENWQTLKKKIEKTFVKIFVFLLSRFCFSLGMLIYTESIFFNWGPPAQPGPPSDMVEECDDSE